MKSNHSIGVVLPTRNCADLLPEHLESMRPWLDIASEIVVVDSYSEDGTVEMVRKGLVHPNLRILSHPRGLYQSWNFGLSQLKSQYAYISTVGDSITRPGLEHLYEVAERFGCQIVASEPRFISNEGAPIDDVRWPVADMCSKLSLTEPSYIEGIPLFMLALFYARSGQAFLGSSASNLYRTDFLQKKPFPVGFGLAGDVAWGIANVFDCRLGLTPECSSTFRHHLKSYSMKEYSTDDTRRDLFLLARKKFETQVVADGVLKRDSEQVGVADFLDLLHSYFYWKQALNKERDKSLFWLIRPKAWRARQMRNRFQRKVKEKECKIYENLGFKETRV